MPDASPDLARERMREPVLREVLQQPRVNVRRAADRDGVAEAIRHLSQLMMVASDDPRVVSEYGKTLASMGRAQEAVNFLTRAQELKPGDWSVYSALGVAYDELGNQKDAGAAYERALVLKPGEPSVLSNYALSRMLANDPDGARKLMVRALAAGGNADPALFAKALTA